MASAYIYQQVWENKLAQRLDKPQNWKDICDVVYTDTQVHNFPLVSTSNEPAVATLTNTAAGRSTLSNVIPFVDTTETNQTLTISIAEINSAYVDYADQAQSNYAKLAALGDLLGKKMNERMEAIVLANHAAWTDIGDDGSGGVGLTSTDLTPSATNIDDIIRGVIEQIQTANGWDLYMANGGFVEWRPSDWTKLVTFMQANGYTFADEALKTGSKGMLGKETMGLFHYVSTSHASGGHIMAGIRKVQKLGILASTAGRIYTNEMPASSTAGSLSGTQIHTRYDYGLLVPTNLLPTIYDINVA
jgi:hypothetical protein